MLIKPLSMCVCSVTQSCLTLCDAMGHKETTSLLCLWDSRGKNTGAGCHFLLQGIFLSPGLDPCSFLSMCISLYLVFYHSPRKLLAFEIRWKNK